MGFVLDGITVMAVLGLVAQGAAFRGRWRLQERRLRELERRGSTPRLDSGECFEVRASAETTDLTGAPVMPALSHSLQASADAFSQRLEHASHNLLQSVEGMRAAADGLRGGTAGLDACYARLEAMYARFEPLADRMADSHTTQERQVSEMAAGLFGITQSLTTVVAGANQSQATVGQVALSVAEAVTAVQETATRLERSVDRLVTAWEAHSAGREAVGLASPRESVTLRLMVEQQQQFINLLDQRLSRPERSGLPSAEPERGYSSSSSSSRSSSCSSSSMPSSTAAKLPPARALSNHSM